MTLRNGTAADVQAMFALDCLCFDPPFTFDLGTMRRLATARSAVVVLAEDGGVLAGFVVLNRQRGRGYVSTLDVRPEFRRQGVAAQLMLEAERQAQEQGIGEVWLHVFAGNRSALRFYERSGYLPAGQECDFYGAGLHALVYRKQLALQG